VRSLPAVVKLPHMGWNRLLVKHKSRLLKAVDANAFFYFAHTYAAINEGRDRGCVQLRASLSLCRKENICAFNFTRRRAEKLARKSAIF